MPLLTLSKFAWVAFARRCIRQISAFPLLVLLGIVGAVAVGAGLIELYRQTSLILSILPASLQYEAQYRLINAITLTTFASYYLVLITLREPARDRSILVTAPIEYSVLWLGTNSVALTLLLTGLTAVMFPLILAILNTRPFALPILSWLGALIINLGLVARAGAIALCVWSFSRFLKLNFRIPSRLGVFIEGGIPLLVSAVFGWPLVQTSTMVVVDPVGDRLSRYLVEPSISQAIWAVVWLLIPSILAMTLASIFLNQANEIVPIVTRESLISQYANYKSHIGQFITCEIKRFLRQKTLLIGYVFLVSLSLLLVCLMRLFPNAHASISALLIPVAPYLGVIFPLLTLHSDLQSEWVFRSAPLPRLTYLTLKLVAAAIIAGATTAIVVLGAAFGHWRISPGMLWNLLSQTLGLTGVAFMLGGFLRRSISDAAGQVFATFLLFTVGATLQYGINASASFLSAWGAGALWIILFAVAPFGVQAWERQSNHEA